jgi:UDP-3-O-[3-hydroxymyristoyl] glucosamine N-acyltransferase
LSNGTPGRALRLDELARLLDLRFSGDAALIVRGVASLEEAGSEDLGFMRDARHLDAMASSRAGAVIVPTDFDASGRAALYSSNPSLDFARAVELVCTPEVQPAGIEPGAHISADAEVHESAWVAAGAVVGARCKVGAGTKLHPNSTLYADVVVGKSCVVHAGVVVRERCVLGDRVVLQPGAVIGGDGFGFVPEATGALHKVPQVGVVIVGDDVEVGANTTIDRASLTQTKIGDRVKLDNLIQIAHGCELGPDVAVAAQSGFSGSTKIGRGTIVMAQVGVAGHLEIGSRAFLGARAGLHKDVADHARVYGTPQMEDRRWHRVMAALKRLPEMLKRLRAVERKLGMRDNDPTE